MFKFLKMIILGMVILATLFTVSAFYFGTGDNLKDKVISAYDLLLQSFSGAGLTSDKELKGERRFGADKYTGTYKASYDGYTGVETIFGGTGLSRKNGERIKVKIKIEKESGNIAAITKLGTDGTTLINEAGTYEGEVYAQGASYYLILELDNFKGNIEIVAQ